MASDPRTFFLPAPFSANGMYVMRRGSRSGRVHSSHYAKWLRESGWEIKRQNVGRKMIFGRVTIRIDLPRGSRMDVDNANKPILDLLQRVHVLENDRQVSAVTVKRTERSDVLIEITEVK